jgi:hypothetical protein
MSAFNRRKAQRVAVEARLRKQDREEARRARRAAQSASEPRDDDPRLLDAPEGDVT